MHIQRAVLAVFAILYITLFNSSAAFAGNNAGYVSSFEADNPSVFERSDVRLAVDHFCRMLSIAPGNKTVRENLKTIISHRGLTAAQRSQVFLLEDHLNYIENLQGRVEYLVSKRNWLRGRLIENGCDRMAVLKGLVEIRDNVSGTHAAVSRPRQPLAAGESPLAIMNGLLADEKAQLSMRIRSLEYQYDWLKAVSKEDRPLLLRDLAGSLEAPVTVFPGGDDAPDLPEAVERRVEQKKPDVPALAGQEPEEADLRRESAEKTGTRPEEAERKSDDGKSTEKFKAELGALYVQLDKLEERIGNEEGKITDLERQVVDLSLKLAETEIRLNEKDEAVDSLTSQLTDVEQRLMLGQKIIEEKNDEIQLVQEDLQKIRLEAESRTAKFKDMIDVKDRELTGLEALLSEADRQKEKLNDIIASKNRHLAQLEAFLRIYQDNLSVFRGTVQEKTVRRKDLLENQLDEKNEGLVQTQRDLRDLEARLTSLQQELLRLEESPQDNGPEGDEVARQVGELQSEFRDINDFLLENLRDSDRIHTYLVVP